MAQQRKIQESEFNINDPKCVRCGSSKLKNSGRYGNRKRYQCQDCRRCFRGEEYSKSVKLNIQKTISNCLHCNSNNFRKNGCCPKTKKQKYQCKDCRKYFYGGAYVKTERPLAYHGNSCPKCKSFDVRLYGKDKLNKKQKYLCNNCGRSFGENPTFASARYILPENITPEKMFNYDIWDMRILGVEPGSNGNYSLTFSKVKPEWLKQAAKEWIRFKSAVDSGNTLCQKMSSIRYFSNFISRKDYDVNPQDIDRKIIIEFIVNFSSTNPAYQSKIHRLGHIRQFFEDCGRFNWIDVTKNQLIFPDDYPKSTKSLPRYIPDKILKQIKDNYNVLPATVVCMIEILLGTGLRTSELLSLKYDCLSQDSTGAYWIRIYQRKMKKEISLIISKELADLIHKQKKFIIDSLNEGWQYLFCDTRNSHDFSDYKNKHKYTNQPLLPLNYFEPWERKLQAKTVRGYLHRFADEMNIRNETGEIFSLGQLHQFRHTHGTELINNGVPQHIVQKRLGHDSPKMTSVYAHIHDKTMKQEMEKFWDGRVFNNQGEVVVSANPELDTAEMQWIKKNMKAQTLPDGFCGLPVTKSCPVEGSPCLSCSHLRTTVEFLDVHRNRLEETEKLIENARANGWNRQIETNLPIAENLKKIIRGLEQKEVVYGDESFPEQDGGEQSA
ncbi:MAG: hypothetical protein RLZZ04_4393 [Cyanobacteriota bacterium]|jgi:integrase/transposase-like protein